MRILYKHLPALAVLTAAGLQQAHGQQLVRNREVVASTGGSGVVEGMTIQYTIGDYAITTLSLGGVTFTQGFQQPEELPPNPGIPSVVTMLIYPNPAVTNVKIQLDLAFPCSLTLMLINSAGQVVYQEAGSYGSGRVVITRPVNHLGAGVYTVMVRGGGFLMEDKLVVQ
jgi:hypothetical protein